MADAGNSITLAALIDKCPKLAGQWRRLAQEFLRFVDSQDTENREFRYTQRRATWNFFECVVMGLLPLPRWLPDALPKKPTDNDLEDIFSRLTDDEKSNGGPRDRWERMSDLSDFCEQQAVAVEQAVAARCQKAAIAAEARPDAVSLENASIVSHGRAMYSIGDALPVRVNDREDAILEAFIERPAMSIDEMAETSGYDRPNEILKKLARKYGGQFAAAIMLPGGRGKGGYRVLVKRAVATT